MPAFAPRQGNSRKQPTPATSSPPPFRLPFMSAEPHFSRLEGFVRDTLGGGASLLYEEEVQPAQTVPVEDLGWSAGVRRGFGFPAAYTHQAETYRLLGEGRHVIVTTPTASGKTGAFFPALFGALEADPRATALLVYPPLLAAPDCATSQPRPILTWVSVPPASLLSEIFCPFCRLTAMRVSF